MAELKPFEMIMRIDYAASTGGNGPEVLAHAEKVQELVRCGECKHHEDEEPGMVYCPKIVGSWVSENWYCANGERRAQE